MPITMRPRVFRYSFVLLAVAAALLLRLALWPLLGSDLPFLFLWPAVMSCAWYGGIGPGLFATLLSALSARFFLLEAQYSLVPVKPADGVGIILYLALGTCLSLVIEGTHRARQQVEQHARELETQREWFRVILASIGDAVIATNAQGRIDFMNGIAQRLTGWTVEHAKGEPLDKILRLVNEQTGLPVDNPVGNILQSGRIVGLDNHTVLLNKGGAEVPIDDLAAPIRNEQGSILGVVVVFRDITARRQLENELQRQAEELVAADHRKDEFLAILAHELRNPLTPIQNAVHLLKQCGSAEPLVLQAAEIIARQVQHARRLVEDLLEIARIRQGKIRLQKEPVELAEVIRQAVETSRPLIDARKHALTMNLSTEPILVEADFIRLAEVVVNLLNNAAKYTDEGGRITLTAEQQQGQAILRVSDNGIGISREIQSRVFDLFAQAPRAVGHAQGGLGIGLSLVRSLIAMHGGSIEVFSKGIGQGSEFVVRLPVLAVGTATRSGEPAAGGTNVCDPSLTSAPSNRPAKATS